MKQQKRSQKIVSILQVSTETIRIHCENKIKKILIIYTEKNYIKQLVLFSSADLILCIPSF